MTVGNSVQYLTSYDGVGIPWHYSHLLSVIVCQNLLDAFIVNVPRELSIDQAKDIPITQIAGIKLFDTAGPTKCRNFDLF